MAIDDNTLYGLTGAQVKDLAERVQSGSVRELTADDFNYPADNPDGVALWLLDTGIYYTTTSIKVYLSTTSHTLYNEFFMVSPKASNDVITIFEISSTMDNIRKTSITDAGYLMFAGRTALWNTQVKNDLTTPSTDNGYILDARQGKVLKDMIDATSAAAPVITLTATDPGEGAPLAANNFIGVYQ